MKKADIENLPGIHWPPKAAIADMMNSIEEMDKFIALWIDKDGFIHYRSANATARDVHWLLSRHIHDLMNGNL